MLNRKILCVVVIGLALSAMSVPVVVSVLKRRHADVVYRVTTSEWQALSDGVDLAMVTPDPPSAVGDSLITVIRVDPDVWELTLLTTRHMHQQKRKTAREWAQSEDLVLAINAGMYHWHNLHDGYMEYRSHVISGETNHYLRICMTRSPVR
jgi:hypothetical protein